MNIINQSYNHSRGSAVFGSDGFKKFYSQYNGSFYYLSSIINYNTYPINLSSPYALDSCWESGNIYYADSDGGSVYKISYQNELLASLPLTSPSSVSVIQRYVPMQDDNPSSELSIGCWIADASGKVIKTNSNLIVQKEIFNLTNPSMICVNHSNQGCYVLCDGVGIYSFSYEGDLNGFSNLTYTDALHITSDSNGNLFLLTEENLYKFSNINGNLIITHDFSLSSYFTSSQHIGCFDIDTSINSVYVAAGDNSNVKIIKFNNTGAYVGTTSLSGEFPYFFKISQHPSSDTMYLLLDSDKIIIVESSSSSSSTSSSSISSESSSSTSLSSVSDGSVSVSDSSSSTSISSSSESSSSLSNSSSSESNSSSSQSNSSSSESNSSSSESNSSSSESNSSSSTSNSSSSESNSSSSESNSSSSESNSSSSESNSSSSESNSSSSTSNSSSSESNSSSSESNSSSSTSNSSSSESNSSSSESNSSSSTSNSSSSESNSSSSESNSSSSESNSSSSESNSSSSTSISSSSSLSLSSQSSSSTSFSSSSSSTSSLDSSSSSSKDSSSSSSVSNSSSSSTSSLDSSSSSSKDSSSSSSSANDCDVIYLAGSAIEKLGVSTDMDGDYLVVGSPYANSNRGQISIYYNGGENNWGSKVTITPSGLFPGDKFGISVGISGDYVVVGMSQGALLETGKAFVYHRTGLNSWDSGFEIVASDAVISDHFGCSVSIENNYVAIGSERHGASVAGAVYVYQRSGTNVWGNEHKVIPSFPILDGLFGYSVSISGGYLLVGSPGVNRAYAYKRIGTNVWGSEYIINPPAGALNSFGMVVKHHLGFAVICGNGSSSSYGWVLQRTSENSWTNPVNLLNSASIPSTLTTISADIYCDYIILVGYDLGHSTVFTRITGNDWIEAYSIQEQSNIGLSTAIIENYFAIGCPTCNGNNGSVHVYNCDFTVCMRDETSFSEMSASSFSESSFSESSISESDPSESSQTESWGSQQSESEMSNSSISETEQTESQQSESEQTLSFQSYSSSSLSSSSFGLPESIFAWLIGDEITGLTYDDQVIVWPDVSGKGNDFVVDTGTVTFQENCVADRVSGWHSGVRMNYGTLISTNNNTTTGLTGMTIFFVISQKVFTGSPFPGEAYLAIEPSSVQDQRPIGNTGIPAQKYSVNGSTSTTAADQNCFDVVTYTISSASYPSYGLYYGSTSVRVNGILEASNSNINTFSTSLLGVSPNILGHSVDATFAEILWFSEELSHQQMKEVENYLLDKYNTRYCYPSPIPLIMSLRGHDSANSANTDVEFYHKTSSGVWQIRIDNTERDGYKIGDGFIFVTMNKADVDGLHLVANAVCANDRNNWWEFALYDGAYDRTSSTDFPTGSAFLIKGNGKIQSYQEYPTGGATDAIVDVSAGDESETQCTFMLRYSANSCNACATWLVIHGPFRLNHPYDYYTVYEFNPAGGTFTCELCDTARGDVYANCTSG